MVPLFFSSLSYSPQPQKFFIYPIQTSHQNIPPISIVSLSKLLFPIPLNNISLTYQSTSYQRERERERERMYLFITSIPLFKSWILRNKTMNDKLIFTPKINPFCRLKYFVVYELLIYIVILVYYSFKERDFSYSFESGG